MQLLPATLYCRRPDVADDVDVAGLSSCCTGAVAEVAAAEIALISLTWLAAEIVLASLTWLFNAAAADVARSAAAVAEV